MGFMFMGRNTHVYGSSERNLFVFGQLGLSRYIVNGMLGFSIPRPPSQDKFVGRRVDFIFCCCGVGV
jgi:hypothetical protein